MRNSRLVLVLFLSVVVCSGLLAAVGLRSLAADTARVDARYREQASGALAAVRGALASVLEEVRRGSAPALAVHVAADGALLEPAPELPPEVESSVPRDRVLYRFTSDEIDRLEREGNDAEARARGDRSRRS